MRVRRTWRSSLVFVVAAFAATVACGATYLTPSARCTDGPRWPRGTNFAYEEKGPIDAPSCTPHCGPNDHASPMWDAVGTVDGREALTSDALPFGACAEDGVVCVMSAEWLGGCPPEGKASGPLNTFICRCRAGAWACTIDATAPSATGYRCELPDGTELRPGAGDAGSPPPDASDGGG